MNKLMISLSTVMLACTLISACQRQDVGMVTGGVIGGVAGSAITNQSTAGTVVGAVGGAAVGRHLAK